MTFVIWLAVVLMLVGAVFLVAGVGASGLWIAVIAVGIARSRSSGVAVVTAWGRNPTKFAALAVSAEVRAPLLVKQRVEDRVGS